MNFDKISSFVNKQWDNEILEPLKEYVRIPNKSPLFDKNWQENGYMKEAMDLVVSWCEAQNIKGMSLEVLNLPGKTPFLYIEVEGHSEHTVLLYGHVDKQPEMRGWDEGKGPWVPVIEDDKLYGRGAADDGYAVFASLTAIKALQEQGVKHGRCVLMIEASEESGSPDLPAYLDMLTPRIGKPELVVCLDSGCGSYDTLWSTTSLRGLILGEMHVKIQKEGMHSGTGSGLVPSWFHVLQKLLARLEDPVSGKIKLEELHVDIPKQYVDQAKGAAKILNDKFLESFSLLDGVQTVDLDVKELLLNQSWRPALTVTGIDGVPSLADAGNVVLPEVSVKLSLRIPPTCDGDKIIPLLRKTLCENTPHGVQVELKEMECGNGWKAPSLAPWLGEAMNIASKEVFNKEAAFFGEGGSIPFMGMLGEKYPEAQFLITGVLGPKSNAHGPNEFLHLPMVKNVTACIASVLHSHFEYSKGNV